MVFEFLKKAAHSNAREKIVNTLVSAANSLHIVVFPAYSEHPGPNADDYIRDPDYPAEAYF
jgi:hypothetical protein